MINSMLKLKSFNAMKGFGYFARSQGNVRVDLTTVLSSGFTAADMVSGKTCVIEFFEHNGSLITTKITSISGQSARGIRTIVDRNGGNVLVKVMIGVATHYEVRQGSVDGELQSDPFHTLAEARLKIGKSIAHPVSTGHGQKTNIVRLKPKNGKDNDNQPGKKKKAA